MRNTLKVVSVVVVVAACLLFADDLRAEEKQPFLWLDTGVKGGVSGYYLSPSAEGDDSIIGTTAPYEKGGGGIGGGFGFFFDVQILKKHLSLETDLFFDKAKIWSTITYNDVLELDYVTRYSTLRIPVLLKGSLVSGITRASLGVGPEFVVGRKAQGDIEVVSGMEHWTEGGLEDADNRFTASKRSDVFLCVDLGLNLSVWKLVVTIDVRMSFNPGLPADYFDRVEIENSGEAGEVVLINTASHSLDLHILLGLAYQFEFPM